MWLSFELYYRTPCDQNVLFWHPWMFAGNHIIHRWGPSLWRATSYASRLRFQMPVSEMLRRRAITSPGNNLLQIKDFFQPWSKAFSLKHPSVMMVVLHTAMGNNRMPSDIDRIWTSPRSVPPLFNLLRRRTFKSVWDFIHWLLSFT